VASKLLCLAGPKFAESKLIQEFAPKFVMINAHDDDEPTDAQYKPGMW